MTSDRVQLVEALTKLGLGGLLAGILSAVIWFNHTEQGMLGQIMENNSRNMEKSNDIQIKLLTAMEENQESHLRVFEKFAAQMKDTGKKIEELAAESVSK